MWHFRHRLATSDSLVFRIVILGLIQNCSATHRHSFFCESRIGLCLLHLVVVWLHLHLIKDRPGWVPVDAWCRTSAFILTCALECNLCCLSPFIHLPRPRIMSLLGNFLVLMHHALRKIIALNCWYRSLNSCQGLVRDKDLRLIMIYTLGQTLDLADDFFDHRHALFNRVVNLF